MINFPNKENFKKRTYLYYLFCLVLTILIVFFWFREKDLIAGGETGIPFYNLKISTQIARYPYIDSQLGIANPFYIHFFPIWKILAFLNEQGIKPYFLQALLFFILLVIPMVTFPRLVGKMFGKSFFWYGIISGIFYLFNFFTISQIWMRFLYSLFFLWSLLPLLLFLWMKWVEDKKYVSLLAFCILSVIFAGMFALPTGIIAVWITLLLYSLFRFLYVSDKLKVVITTSLGFLAWVLVSFWWLLPFLQLRNNSYSSNLNSILNLESLVQVSKYYPNKDLIILKQKYFYSDKTPLNDLGKNNFSNTVSLLSLFFVIAGIIGSLRSKNWQYLYLIVLVILGWFVSKGANPPLGYEFYKFIYSKFPILQVFRNPYEKFGVVFLLPYSIIIGLGLIRSLKIFRKYRYYLVVTLLGFLIYSFSPFYLSDKIFPGIIKIKIPDSYKLINQNIAGDERILHLPILFESSTQYTWGYNGEDASMYLFKNPSISSPTSIKSIDDFHFGIRDSFLNGQYKNILSVTNTKYLVLHNDKILKDYEFLSDYNKVLSQSKNVKHIGTFGDLELYENEDALVGYIYAVNHLVYSKNPANTMELLKDPDLNIFDSAIVDADEKDPGIISDTQNKELPTLSFVKLNPVDYEIEVDNKEGNFILVLANNFNTLWVAQSEEKIFNKHFKVNGFANAWLVDKIGKYSISVRFNPLASGIGI